MKRIALLVAGLALAAWLPACSSGPAPIRLGAVYPLSGTQGPGGLDEFHGVELAADLVNQRGGVDGRRIELVPIDVPGSDAGPAAIQELAREGVRLVLGSYGSTISVTAGQEAARRGMLFWETGAVGSMPGPGPGRYFFRVAPGGQVLGRTAVDFITDRVAAAAKVSPGELRFAVINVADPYGGEVAKGAVEAVHARGLDLAAQIAYDPHHYDPAAIVRRIAASGANVVFAAAYLDDGVAVRREMVRQHLRLVASIGTSSSYCMPQFGAELGRDALGLFASDKPDGYAISPKGLLPAARTLLAQADHAYEERYHAELSAPALAGFAAAWSLFHDVLPRATGDSAAAVATAALAARVPEGGLPNGSGLRFAGGGIDAGNNTLAASVIWEWVRVGERAIVWPPRFATQDMVPMTPLA